MLIEQWAGDVEPKDEDKTIILVDTSPDLREQLLATGVKHIDAVLYTHDHADQSHGIDDLRALAYRMRSRIPVYMDDTTKDSIFERFGYCFEKPDGRIHPVIFDAQDTFKSKDKLQINGTGGIIDIVALELSHGIAPSFGFKFNEKLVYTPDVLDIENDVLDVIKGAKTWICDALKYNRSPAHANVDKTLMWQAYTQVPNFILTNLHVDMDYATLSSEVTAAQIVGYDGQELLF